jgi:hypothetical protein
MGFEIYISYFLVLYDTRKIATRRAGTRFGWHFDIPDSIHSVEIKVKC